jgi:hypothetical protein
LILIDFCHQQILRCCVEGDMLGRARGSQRKSSPNHRILYSSNTVFMKSCIHQDKIEYEPFQVLLLLVLYILVLGDIEKIAISGVTSIIQIPYNSRQNE